MACCARANGLSPQATEQTRRKLKEVTSFIPGVYFACVLAADGELVAFENTKVEKPQDVMAQVAALKKSALELG